MTKFQKIVSWLMTGIDKVTIGFGYCAAGLTLVLIMLVIIAIFFRYVLNRPLIGADEISAYLFVTLNMAALSYATYGESHVAAEVLYARLGNKFQFIVTIVSYVLAFVICGVITYYGASETWKYFSRGWISSTALQVPLWPVIATIPLGFTMFGLQCLSRIYAVAERMHSTSSVIAKTPFEM